MLFGDTIKTTCQELFTVLLLHPAFEVSYTYKEQGSNIVKSVTGSSIFNALSVTPDGDTQQLFDHYAMACRAVNDTIICFVRTDQQKTFLPIPGPIHIRLLLQDKAAFLYHTVAVATGTEQVYFFSNSAHSGPDKFITKQATGVTDDDLQAATLIKPDQNCFGVIDIFSDGNSAGYNLFGAGGTLASPTFTIRFRQKGI